MNKEKYRHDVNVDCLWCGKKSIGRLCYNDNMEGTIGCICECQKTTWIIAKAGMPLRMTKETGN